MTEILSVYQGTLYLPAELCAEHLAGLRGVALIRSDRDLLLMPVRDAGAECCPLSVRTLLGDRVIDVRRFLSDHGLDDDIERDVPVVWSDAVGGLVASGLFDGGEDVATPPPPKSNAI